MTVSMTSEVDYELAGINDTGLITMSNEVIADGHNADPMSLVNQLPEVSVPINLLVPGFHLRQEGTDPAHVRLLADAAGSVRLPSILVQKSGSRIIDGLHRLEVAKLRGEWTISARIVDCTDVEALVLAIKTNTLHGLPLSRADRISGAKRMLTAHPDWSDRAVAGVTGLSAKSIASLRNSAADEVPFYGKRLGRDGKRHPVMPNEGRLRAAEYIKAHPDASLREIARETDVSLGTVHTVREKIRRGAEPGPETSARPSAPSNPPVRALHPQLGLGAEAGARGVPRLAWPMISAKLASDPSLRYTEGGRAFLRWMSGHCLGADQWHEFIDAIPQHWLPEVSRIAASMSEEWRQFAERLGTKLEAAS
jgi:transposase-like protein